MGKGLFVKIFKNGGVFQGEREMPMNQINLAFKLKNHLPQLISSFEYSTI